MCNKIHINSEGKCLSPGEKSPVPIVEILREKDTKGGKVQMANTQYYIEHQISTIITFNNKKKILINDGKLLKIIFHNEKQVVGTYNCCKKSAKISI